MSSNWDRLNAISKEEADSLATLPYEGQIAYLVRENVCRASEIERLASQVQALADVLLEMKKTKA